MASLGSNSPVRPTADRCMAGAKHGAQSPRRSADRERAGRGRIAQVRRQSASSPSASRSPHSRWKSGLPEGRPPPEALGECTGRGDLQSRDRERSASSRRLTRAPALDRRCLRHQSAYPDTLYSKKRLRRRDCRKGGLRLMPQRCCEHLPRARPKHHQNAEFADVAGSEGVERRRPARMSAIASEAVSGRFGRG